MAWSERERVCGSGFSVESQDKASVAVFSRKNTTDDPSSRLSSKQQRSRRKLNLNHNRTKMVEKEKLFLSCRATLFSTFPKRFIKFWQEGQFDVVQLMLNNQFKAFSINFAENQPMKIGSRKSKNSKMTQNDHKI